MSTLLSRIDGNVLLGVVSVRSAAQVQIANAFGNMFTVCGYYQIDTPLRLSHFIAQTAHESDSFKTTVEYASGVAYEGRKDLGNTKPGDGPRFKGHGVIQLTGRDNHRAFTNWMRKRIQGCPDFELLPELAAQFPWAGWAAIYYWSEHNLNALADRDDLIAVTKAINGGLNGLNERSKQLVRAKTAVATIQADLLSGEQVYPVLRRGMAGPSVAQLQRGLKAAGFYHLSIDGHFAGGTEQAVRACQQAYGLTVDGIAGAKTFDALRTRNFLPATSNS